MARMTPPKSPMVCEKYQTGCMWRLYGLFDFRQSHSDKKLLSDKRHSNRFDYRISKTKLDLLNNLDEKSQSMDDKMTNRTQTVDSGMASKRKHKGEKLSTELQMNKKIDSDELKHMQSNSKLACQLPKKKGKASKSSQISHPLSPQGLKYEAKNGKPSYSVSVETSSNKLNSAALAKEVRGKKRRGFGCKSINYEITLPQVQKNAAEAIRNQKFIDEKYIRIDGVNHQSRQLSDALEILNSNKELFIKLLQDPNSLLAKHIEDLRESQAVKHQIKSPSDVNVSEPRRYDGPAGNQKSKSCDTYSSEESDDSHFSDRIVVLKPGPTSMQSAEDNIKCSSLQSYYSLRNNGQSEMPANISFSQIKKKLRHAIGVSRKEQHSKSMDGTLHGSPCEGSKEDCKGKGVEIIRRNSPGGGMIMSSLDVKKRDNMSEGRECESQIQCETASTSGSGLGNLNISVVCHPRLKESESSLEARLLELLNSGNKDRNHKKQELKTLERVISFPEHDFLPTRSPVGLSPNSNCQLLYENKWRLQKEKTSCSSPTENNRTMRQGEINSLKQPSESESACRNGTVETKDTVHPGENSSLGALRRSNCMEKTSTTETSDTVYQGETDPAETLSELNCKDKALDWSTDKADLYEEDEYIRTSRQEQPSTSSPDVFQSPPRIQRGEDSASIEDKGEHPSPVSVLEQFFVDTISEPAEEHHSARLVRSPTDTDSSSTSSLNEHELISEYIQAVLRAASLDWDEISMMCDSTDQLLDPFLFDTVKLQANLLKGDCMLLFDCIDEVLVEVYHSDLRYSPWPSFIKPNVRRLPIEKTVIHKVMKYVDGYLSLHPSPRTLQQVVQMDIARSGTWIDIRKDAEDVVFQMVEDVLEELIIETII
ncbi:uncharacterized protein LOC133743549 [Rosa rugosa]|uniref:uncharacterized protein LOC133743549 n=1 Tax=Rosa rugosa TaxID=74645 RepID=UPI002B40A807|nr:uncharacterized protein LOC133743549 [Rosa rugosa]XP_062027509.1 uncharacterized protein LOC133743549 [Rosa rugosa]